MELSPRAISATIKMQDTQMSECISFSLLLLLLVVSFLLAGLGWLLCLFSGNTPHQSAFALPQRTPESDFETETPTSTLRSHFSLRLWLRLLRLQQCCCFATSSFSVLCFFFFRRNKRASPLDAILHHLNAI